MVEVDVTESHEKLTQIKNTSVQNTLTLLFYHFLKHGPQTDEELSFFIKEYLHLHIPDIAICPNHTTPMKMIADLFFERVRTVFGFANRSGGKTQDLAVLNFLDSYFKGVKVVNAGATLNQSGLCYDYYLNFWNEPLINSSIMIERSVQSETVLANGGSVNIVAGTRAGFNGPHPNKARIDEVELLDWSVLQEGLSMSITETNHKGKHLGQDVLTSTRKTESGTVERLIKEAPKRNIKIFNWCVLESIERCEHDCHNFKATHKDDPDFKYTKQCPIYETYDISGNPIPFCSGQAHHANGFIPVEEVIKKTSILDAGTLDLQWKCLKGRSDTAVYKDFYAPNVHELTYEEFKYKMKKELGSYWEDYINRKMQVIGGIDFGANHATELALKHDTPILPTFYFIDEHYVTPEQEVLNETHVKEIKKLEYYRKGMTFWADYAQRQDILEFRSLKLNVLEANKSVFAGIDYVKSLLQRRGSQLVPHLYIVSDRCPFLCKQMLLYSHPKKADGTIEKDKIVVQQDDHAPDALRYLVYSDKTIPTGYRAYKTKL